MKAVAAEFELYSFIIAVVFQSRHIIGILYYTYVTNFYEQLSIPIMAAITVLFYALQSFDRGHVRTPPFVEQIDPWTCSF